MVEEYEVLQRQNSGKAAGTDLVSSSAFKFCADELTTGFTDIFNRANRSAEDPVSLCLHYILKHLEARVVHFLKDGMALLPLTIKVLEVERVNSLNSKRERMLQFYRAVIENVLIFSISVWYGNSTAQQRKQLDRVVLLIISRKIAPISDIYKTRI
ncbi:hypothetical protein NFI96_029061 [Scomber scombrus]|uniref:Uncharacterized protein n=1 Tax=Scomber scombrus TaxID=13677 RepID=A0AAV1MXZ4_SCOSC